MRAARLGPGQRVLDVATGTGIVARAVAELVGPSGSVVAADISRPMLDQAQDRLRDHPNVSVAEEDSQHMTFPDASFDAVLCGLGLMLFREPAKALSEFRRVLRDGGRVAVSVNTTSGRSFVSRVLTAIGRHVPERAGAAALYFSLGDAARLRTLFAAAGFREVETATELRRYPFPSFDAYFAPIERGFGSLGAEFASLPAALRAAVREDVRRELAGEADAGGAIEVPVELLFGSGRR
nr:methyltransferase domain-containing protein [Neoroseomonas eburnea]